MITIPAGGDYFDQIDIILSNKYKICIVGEDAISDGYTDVWYEKNNL